MAKKRKSAQKRKILMHIQYKDALRCYVAEVYVADIYYKFIYPFSKGWLE